MTIKVLPNVLLILLVTSLPNFGRNVPRRGYMAQNTSAIIDAVPRGLTGSCPSR